MQWRYYVVRKSNEDAIGLVRIMSAYSDQFQHGERGSPADRRVGEAVTHHYRQKSLLLSELPQSEWETMVAFELFDVFDAVRILKQDVYTAELKPCTAYTDDVC